MDAAELKKLQTPLKDKYRNDPESAILTLRAAGKTGDNVSCKVETGREIVEAGLHPYTGGTGILACSGDLLLEALVACAGVTLSAVATSIGIEIQSCEINAEGDLDFRGTLGVSKEAPVGFKTIRLFFDVKSDASVEQLDKLISLTERYCVVLQTIKSGVGIEASRIDNR